MSTESKKEWVRMNGVANEYAIKTKVGRGTFGTVFKANAVRGNKQYAIKKLENNDPKMVAEGFPITALRQIMLLKEINHPNIVKLHEIIASKPSKNNLYRGSTFLVFQYMHHDLAGLIKSKVKFSLPEIKCIAKQILQGINYLHSMRILHRDIKSANILFNKDGEIKIGDFGLGRKYRPDVSLTHKVVTLWYRAPELILASKFYDYKIDVWSIGCVLAELLTGEILFRKQTEFAQLERIFQIMGDYDYNKVPHEVIAKFTSLKQMLPSKSFNRQFESQIRKLNPEIGDDAISLLSGMLDINPNKRFTCQEALDHAFFTSSPISCKPSQIQKFPHEMKEFFRENSCRIQYDKKQESRKKQDDKKHYDRYEGKYEHRKDYRNQKNRYKDRYYDKSRYEEHRKSKSKDHHKKERREDHDKQKKHRSLSSDSHSSHHRSREKYQKRKNEDYHVDKKYQRDNRDNSRRHDHYHRSEKYSDQSYREDSRKQREYEKDTRSAKQQHYHRHRNQNDYPHGEGKDHRRDKYQSQKKQGRQRKDYQEKDRESGEKYKEETYRKKEERSYGHDDRRHRQNRDVREFKREEKNDREQRRYQARPKYEKIQRNEKMDRYGKEERYDSKSQRDEDYRQKKYYDAQRNFHKYDRQGSNNNHNRPYKHQDRYRGYRDQKRDDRYRQHSHSLKRQQNQYRQRSRQKKSRSRDRNQKPEKPYRNNKFPMQPKKEEKPQKQKQAIQDNIEY